MTTDSYLDELEHAAAACEAAEAEFRRTMKERVAALAAERAFANRRMNVMRSLFQTVRQAETREIAVAGAVAALRQRLGWREDSPARDEVLSEYAKVADAAFGETRADADAVETDAASRTPSVREALAGFETWYLDTRGTAFWVLFEHYMPETQRVDF
jgi:hypothetical protein